VRRGSVQPVTITTSGYVVLGMLRVGSRSGYEIRRSAELSLRHFWSISPPQVYGELAKLEQAKLIRGTDDPRGNRRRRTFRINAAGERALRDWLLRAQVTDLEIRDVLQLKLFFADVLEPDDARSLIDAVRERSNAYLHKLEHDVLPAAEKTVARHKVEFPPRIARLHVELHEFLLSWCDRLEGELERA
jgi:PadR family transcriptional regulator AphA